MGKQPHKPRRYKAEIKPSAFDIHGRPCQKRNLIISCIVSAEERAAIIEAATAAQLSLSAFLRAAAFGFPDAQDDASSETPEQIKED